MGRRLTPEEKQRREELKKLKAQELAEKKRRREGERILKEQELAKKRQQREEHRRMTEKEKNDWAALYEYVKSNVMRFDENQSLSQQMVLRLKGLSTNKFMENNNTKNTANYSFETILNTFKFCYPSIQKALRTNMFVNEMHKFNYVLKIVEPEINDMYIRMKNVEKAKEEAKNMTVESFYHVGAEYKPKEKKKDKFADLW